MAPSATRTAREMWKRSIRVMVSPAPATFAERRSILQVLERYGPVDMFRMSPGQHSNFISVTSEESTAQRLVSMSPISYEVSRPQTMARAHVADLAYADSQPRIEQETQGAAAAKSHKKAGGQRSREPSLQSMQSRGFRLDIFPAPEYNHQFAMSGTPEHHAWPASYEADRSFGASTLKQVLPHNTARKGLAHWLVDMGTAGNQGSKAKRLQLKNWLPSKMRLRQGQ